MYIYVCRRTAKRERKELDYSENTYVIRNKRARANKNEGENYYDSSDDAETQERCSSIHSVESMKASPEPSQQLIVDKQKYTRATTTTTPPPPHHHHHHHHHRHQGSMHLDHYPHNKFSWNESPNYLQGP